MRSAWKCRLLVEHRKWEAGVTTCITTCIAWNPVPIARLCASGCCTSEAELGLGAPCVPLPTWEVKPKLNLGKLLPLFHIRMLIEAGTLSVDKWHLGVDSQRWGCFPVSFIGREPPSAPVMFSSFPLMEVFLPFWSDLTYLIMRLHKFGLYL